MRKFKSGTYASYNDEIKSLHDQGCSNGAIARLIHAREPELNEESFRKYVGSFVAHARDQQQYKTDAITTDKKIGQMSWREWIDPMKKLQELGSKAKGSQDHAMWSIDTDQPICVVVLGDTQLGSWATDYDMFMEITREILETPNLYVILVGDLMQMAIKLRGVLEVNDNLLPAQFQMIFLASWLNEVKHKIIASTWDNHSVMREEDAVGFSTYAEIFKRHTIYFNGIGHLDMKVGNQIYKWAVSHFYRGKSLLNKTHAPQRYLRHEGQDRDIAAQGDFHDPGFSWYNEGGRERLAIVCGSIQVNSGYAKRFFSLTTHPVFPCVELYPKEKMMIPYKSVKHWLAAKGQSIQSSDN